MRLSDVCGVDLPTAALEKMKKNELKYPVGKSFGRADKYIYLEQQELHQGSENASSSKRKLKEEEEEEIKSSSCSDNDETEGSEENLNEKNQQNQEASEANPPPHQTRIENNSSLEPSNGGRLVFNNCSHFTINLN